MVRGGLGTGPFPITQAGGRAGEFLKRDRVAGRTLEIQRRADGLLEKR